MAFQGADASKEEEPGTVLMQIAQSLGFFIGKSLSNTKSIGNRRTVLMQIAQSLGFFIGKT